MFDRELRLDTMILLLLLLDVYGIVYTLLNA